MMISLLRFCLLASPLFLPAITALPQTNQVKEATPARLCLALSQPGENETVAWNQGKPMWKKAAYPGYGMGEYILPAGPLAMELRHPSRPPLPVNQKVLPGKCYLLVVDQKPNSDPKTKEQFPVVTDAQWVELPWGEPSPEPAAYTYVAASRPISFCMNGKQVSLSPGRVEKLAGGYMLFSDTKGNPLMDLNPSGGSFLLLVFFQDSANKIAPVRCQFY